MTQEAIILKYLEYIGGWVREGSIRGINTQWGFLGYRGDRTVRDLIKAGKIRSSMDGKYRIVAYKPSFNFLPSRKPIKTEKREKQEITEITKITEITLGI